MRWLEVISSMIVTSWILSALIRSWFHRTLSGAARWLTRTLFYELRPLYLPAAIIAIGLEMRSDRGDIGALAWDAFFGALSIVNWFLYKDDKHDDDDRWKRRRQKVAEKVSVVAGRLTVVPAGAN